MGQITMFKPLCQQSTHRTVRLDPSAIVAAVHILFTQNIILRAFLQAEDKESQKRQQNNEGT